MENEKITYEYDNATCKVKVFIGTHDITHLCEKIEYEHRGDAIPCVKLTIPAFYCKFNVK